jgi:hypothetical protein
LYQQVLEQISATAAPSHIRITSVRRLALLVSGILAAKSTVVFQVAQHLLALQLTSASYRESIERRLRRTLNDASLTQERCYQPVLKEVIPWQLILKDQKRVFIIVDESSKADHVHLFRVSLPYWGGSLALAWAIWEQNLPLEDGQYWAKVDEVFARVAAILPQGIEVIVLADRAYDCPPFIDRLSSYGWHFAVRCKAKGSLYFRDYCGKEQPLAELISKKVSGPGKRFKANGWVFKKAGWRPVSVVALWAKGEKEALVVLSDLGPSWEVMSWYGRRFWTEPGFRNDKSKGFCWEDSQVNEVCHQQVMLVGMAWASLVTLCLGAEEAQAKQKLLELRAQKRTRPPRPQKAKESVFTMGLGRVRSWLYRTASGVIRWLLPLVGALSWNQQWYQHQASIFIFKSVRL